MPNVKPLIRELAKYAAAKKGAKLISSLDYPNVTIPALKPWMTFFELAADGNIDEGRQFARLPVQADALQRHRKTYPVLRQSSWRERDGHIYMEVPLDAELPIAFLKSLIDEAHSIKWNLLGADDRLKIELAGLPYDEPKIMDRLIDVHNLKEHRKAIHRIARPAILLRTRKTAEARIAEGATKIGGQPDLPENIKWPAFRDGKLLPFLAQINLDEIAKLRKPIKGLPSTGLLSVFSVWGLDEGYPPMLERPQEESGQEENGATMVLHLSPRVKLKRRKPPRGVTSFKAASVEPTPNLSLPNYRVVPPLAALRWSDDEYERFDQMQMDFGSIQSGHFRNKNTMECCEHQLGGYALFQQEFPKEVLEKGLAMILQIGTDGNTSMAWGDGGELTFYADARALEKGRFERLWGTCQCG